MSARALRVAIAGLGTVGGGTLAVLTRNAEVIARRAGRPVQVVAIADLDTERVKASLPAGSTIEVYSDAMAMLAQAKPDVVVELIGGTGFAQALMKAAIDQKVHVVTANKALLAKHGNELFAQAQAQGVTIRYEAAVAGGIPIIKALREGLTANRIESVVGIINGTTNFILSTMRDKGQAFAEVLAEAQRLGYAEADPTFDVEGHDAGHKLSLMAAIAFGMPVRFDQVSLEGITALQATDITYAEKLGYRIKLLGIARRREHGVELRVHPTLVPARHLLANVEGAMNAVLVTGDAVGQTLYTGKGAGAEPTASAVIADLVDLARASSAASALEVPALAFQAESLEALPVLPMADAVGGHYLRLRVKDQPGVLADITRQLADHHISIDAFIQQEPAAGSGQTDVVLITHPCEERALRLASGRLAQLPSVLAEPVSLRVEFLA